MLFLWCLVTYSLSLSHTYIFRSHCSHHTGFSSLFRNDQPTTLWNTWGWKSCFVHLCGPAEVLCYRCLLNGNSLLLLAIWAPACYNRKEGVRWVAPVMQNLLPSGPVPTGDPFLLYRTPRLSPWDFWVWRTLGSHWAEDMCVATTRLESLWVPPGVLKITCEGQTPQYTTCFHSHLPWLKGASREIYGNPMIKNEPHASSWNLHKVSLTATF